MSDGLDHRQRTVEWLSKQNSERPGGHGQKLKYRKLHWNAREDFLIVRVLKRGSGDSPGSYLKPRWTVMSWAGLGGFRGSFQPQLPYDPVKW